VKGVGKASEPFVVARRRESGDLLEWAARNASLLEAGLDLLATEVPLPHGGQIALLCAAPGGEITVVDILEDEKETVHRLGRVFSFLRQREEWLRSAFPGKDLRLAAPPRLLLLGEDFTPSLPEALGGLAFAATKLIRVRDLESADGRRILLVEREEEEEASAPAPVEYDLTPEEEDFFHRMEEEKRALQSLEKTG